MPTDTEADVLRILIDLLRDQGKLLTEVATTGAVSADRLAQVTTVLARLDGYLARQEAGVSAVQAAQAAQAGALTKLMTTVTKGLKSGTGQRVIQTLVLALVGWATLHGYLPIPGAAS